MKPNIYNSIFLLLAVMFLQAFIPVFKIYNFFITSDIMIILLTYIGFYYGRIYSIVFGFLFGLIQDLTTQIDLMGAMSFTKSVFGYFLGSLALYNTIWSIKFRVLFIIFIYKIHFIIFYYIRFNGVPIDYINIISIIIINTFLSFLILIVFDKVFIKKGIFFK